MKLQEIVDQAVDQKIGKKENNTYSIKIECNKDTFDSFNEELEKATTQYIPKFKADNLPFTYYKLISYYGVELELHLNEEISGYKIDAN
jgi:hypothetical protein